MDDKQVILLNNVKRLRQLQEFYNSMAGILNEESNTTIFKSMSFVLEMSSRIADEKALQGIFESDAIHSGGRKVRPLSLLFGLFTVASNEIELQRSC